MHNRRQFMFSTGIAASAAPAAAQPAGDRNLWITTLDRIAQPVLENLAKRRLKAVMPVEGKTADRPEYTHLEALGRTLAGVAPWLELKHPADGPRRSQLAEFARQAIDAATDPRSPDYLNFDRGRQPLVDAAFLAHGILRAPRELWQALPESARRNTVAALKLSRTIPPAWNNWLLFAAMVEAALHMAGEKADMRPVTTAMNLHENWYKGDGWYGDGPDFHWDYYNSFVIQPMLLDVARVFEAQFKPLYPKLLARARRHAAVQERLISPEGSFPPIGRSLAYRIGAFQLLGQISLMKELPAPVKPEQVRGALTAVLKRQMLAPGTFDAKGWLRVGFVGSQPDIGETYISTGSCYLCCVGFLPLGLPPEDRFWSGPETPWTAKQIWAGQDAAPDHAS